MNRVLNSVPLLYIALLIPGVRSLRGLVDTSLYYPEMMYISGVWSIQLLFLTIAVTPTLIVINKLGTGKAFGRWLLKRRRHFGLASFVFAAAHAAHYVLYVADLSIIFAQTLRWDYALGWLGFAIFLALAVTSNATSARALGRKWKTLHLAIYPAIALSFLHWYLFDAFTQQLFFWMAYFGALKLVHILLKPVPVLKRV